jgi:hypothetical protein
MQSRFGYPVLFLLASVLLAANPASAMSSKECSEKFQQAKNAGTLAGRNWYAFRTAECGIATSGDAAGSGPKSAVEPVAAQAARPVAAVAAPAGLSLPSAIDPKYSAEKPARARLHTCADAYKAHKRAGTLAGLKWIQKGGGFYSLCNRKLKVGA